ncbi:hypothetical protein [Jannaschia sp. CCS1]|uniref:hypothetical protein n=1 Tax=Jannaschia sp. (strain CCS1) TaxID=290400 RepID=UPI000053CE6E|nr:hypothetical protein [Jannaschia sp. CCS1]ABD54101.1 lipoprotein putative [Jannaschia sp. CCS1]
MRVAPLRSARFSTLAGVSAACLIGCLPATEGPTLQEAPPATYDGIETRLLDDDLVNFRAQMTGVASRDDLDAYARCAAVQYTLIRGYSYARHVRTSITEEGGVWAADAVYTISPDLPRGLQTLEAESVAADCAEQGIPTV